MQHGEHPLVEIAAAVMAEAGDEPYTIDTAGRERLAAAVDAYLEEEDLPEGIADLIRFGVYVGEEERSESAARTILDCACIATDALHEVAGERRAAVQEAEARSASLVGRARDHSAPGYDDPAPEGSVKLSRMLSPSKLTP